VATITRIKEQLASLEERVAELEKQAPKKAASATKAKSESE
jgi:Tfp pilus assembly protein PilO